MRETGPAFFLKRGSVANKGMGGSRKVEGEKKKRKERWKGMSLSNAREKKKGYPRNSFH